MQVDLAPGAATNVLRCPATPRFTGDLVGCGSTEVTQPDDEGLCDCLSCGLWFRASECHVGANQPRAAA